MDTFDTQINSAYNRYQDQAIGVISIQKKFPSLGKTDMIREVVNELG